MQVIKTGSEREVTLSVIGTIDTVSSEILQESLMALDYSDLDLTIDFSQTDYITSAGLRTLLVARKKLTDTTMRVVEANDAIIEVFKMTGFDEMIKVIPKMADLDGEEDPYRLSFTSLFRRRVKADANRAAIIYLNQSYTWADIDKASQVIAHDLVKKGVKRGTHVGICSVNSINWIFTFYAIQKLGGIAVLVNPGLNSKELATMARIGDITHMCYSEIPGYTEFETVKQTLLESDCPVQNVYNISPTVNFMARCNEYDAISGMYKENFHADDASVIIYSSGSTGLPKAILDSSFNLLTCCEPLLKEFKLTNEDVNLAFLPLFHVFGFVTCIALGVLIGNTSVIPESTSPDLIIGLIDRYKATIFNTVPTMFLAMCQAKTFDPAKLASLRVSILGGSATTDAQMNMLRKLVPNNHFGNIYGMSENAAVSITRYEDTVEHITTTVGVPVEGLQLEIRDLTTKEALPVGETGEIYIKSNAMVICYYRLPIDRQPVDDEGWLATGDLGIVTEDGYVKIVGRCKDLIISGGENISPGEIAEEIAKMPEVADVKVLGGPDEIRGEVVAAAIILKPGAVWKEENANAILGQQLAKYKMPRHYFILDKFPLLGSGKVDAITLKKMLIEKM